MYHNIPSEVIALCSIIFPLFTLFILLIKLFLIQQKETWAHCLTPELLVQVPK